MMIRSLLAQLRHTIYVSAVDKQGNRIDAPPRIWTLQPINIQPELKVPLSAIAFTAGAQTLFIT